MNKIHYVGFAAFAFLMILSGSLFSVDQRQNGVVFQFGEAVRVIESPGLNIKIPFIQNVQFFDKRILDVKAEAKELTASDEKRVIVDAFAKFRIVNTVEFIKTRSKTSSKKSTTCTFKNFPCEVWKKSWVAYLWIYFFTFTYDLFLF